MLVAEHPARPPRFRAELRRGDGARRPGDQRPRGGGDWYMFVAEVEPPSAATRRSAPTCVESPRLRARRA